MIHSSVLALTLLLAMGWSSSSLSQTELPPGALKLKGQPAPGVHLTDLDGTPFDLKTARGSWVLVHFWASWCGPCRREMPAIQRMATIMEQTSLQIILINTAEDEDTVFGFMGIAAPEMRTLLDTDGQVTENWQPRGLPATFLVDPAGKLRYLVLGGQDWDSPAYLGFLRQLLKQP